MIDVTGDIAARGAVDRPLPAEVEEIFGPVIGVLPTHALARVSGDEAAAADRHHGEQPQPGARPADAKKWLFGSPPCGGLAFPGSLLVQLRYLDCPARAHLKSRASGRWQEGDSPSRQKADRCPLAMGRGGARGPPTGDAGLPARAAARLRGRARERRKQGCRELSEPADPYRRAVSGRRAERPRLAPDRPEDE